MTPPGPKDYDNIESQLKIIESEFKELKDNWDMNNLNGMRDDIGDVLFTVLGLAHVMGFPADDDLRLVWKFRIRVVDDIAVDKGDDIRLLFDFPTLTQIRKLWAFVGTVL